MYAIGIYQVYPRTHIFTMHNLFFFQLHCAFLTWVENQKRVLEICTPRWWALACLSLLARSERRLARSERNWIGETVLSRHLNQGSVWTHFSVQQEVGISLNNNEVWSWTFFYTSTIRLWKRLMLPRPESVWGKQSAQLLDEFVFWQWQLSWKMEISRSVFAFTGMLCTCFMDPKESELVVAGSVQGLTTLAPGVLSQAHACACACDDCDTLAQRLNQKLQLGQNHCFFLQWY